MARCPYCGEFTKGDACEDHDDLPALDPWLVIRLPRLDMNDQQIVDKLLATTAKGK